ncbi:AT-rich interactive domain-containing protein 2 [Clonorchis sinensis]|uniref:AT-rich interactive domain-containing protein 2 n=1 Tax=Clonorchis sinensis TaxID=79923 RepID=A0A8T1ML98_CLOSI|nr:AT-rich interactive domain-containing protein 2 [Clonorchis sinensis]
MNRQKRIASCPGLFAKVLRSRDIEVGTADVLKKIQRKCGRFTPRILGHPIKLPALFTAVVVRGGYRMVCDKRLWSDVASELQLPNGCTNSGIGLRRIYHQFLIKVEFEEYPSLTENYLAQNYTEFPSDPVDGDSICPQATSVERNLGIAHPDGISHPSHSNHYSYADSVDGIGRGSYRGLSTIQDPSWQPPSMSIRLSEFSEGASGSDRTGYIGGSGLNDPTRLRDLTELRLAELALESGLPNEVDVALNSLLALSISPSSTGVATCIRLSHCKNLLSLLLATVGVYDDSSTSFVICDPIWRQQNQLDFLRFWHNMVQEPNGRLFLRQDVFIDADIDKSDEGPSSTLTTLFAPVMQYPCEIDSPCTLQTVAEETLETSRVLLVATVLVNLVTAPPGGEPTGNHSAEDDDDESTYDVYNPRSLSPCCTPLSTWRENARFVAASPTAVRFAFLCAYAEHSGVRQLGLQLLSSLRFPLDPPPYSWSINCPLEWTPLVHEGCHLGDLTLAFISRCIMDSPDRMSLIGGLNFLANLATVPNRANEASLLNGLPSAIWPRLAQLICLPDLNVVCSTLEALRCLTNLGTYACAFAWQACAKWTSSAPNTLPLALLQPLLALLTLEGQAMGSQSLHRIKLMQRAPPIVLTPSNSPYSHQPIRPSSTVRVQNQSAEWTIQRHQPPPYPFSVGQRRPATPPSLHLIKPNVQMPPNRPLQPRPIMPARATIRHPPTACEPEPSILTPNHVTANHRAPNASTNCTGLITLLASPSTALPTIPALAATTSTTLCTVNYSPATFTSPPLKTSANTSPPPSLSELTDRLQMPPPSLPPPSALRRSSKLSQSRSLMSPSSPNSKTPNHSPRSYLPNLSSTNPQQKQEESSGDRPSFHSNQEVLQSESVSDRVVMNETSEHAPEVVGVDLMVCSTASETIKSESVSSSSSEGFKHSPPLASVEASKQRLKPDEIEGQLDTNTLFNGKEEKLEDDVSNLSEPDTKLSIPTSDKLSSPSGYQVNGLKPGLLQAAVDAIDDKMNSLKKSSMDMSDCLRNGFDDKRGDPICDPKNNGLEDVRRKTRSSAAIREPTMNGHLEDPTDKPCAAHRCCSPDRLVNGTVSSDSDPSSGNSGSDNSENESPPPNQRPTVRRYHRLLKRRRRLGIRSRWLQLKRRRDTTHSKEPPATSTSNENQKNTSPLKPLPLQMDPLPNSVLGPAWKPTWCPTTRTNVALTVPSSSAAERTPSPSDSILTQSRGYGHSTTPSHPDEYSSLTYPSPKYICAWETCSSSFAEKHEVSTHVYVSHLMGDLLSKPSPTAVRRCCRWRNCKSASLARAPFALLTHVLDAHCTTALDMQPERVSPPSASDSHGIKRISSPASSCPSSTVNLHHMHTTASNDPGTPGDQSAWSIIRSIEMRQMQHDLWTAQHHFMSANPHCRPPFPPPPPLPPQLLPPREGPVTKHLRVSAALVLRNFVTYLEEARTWLKSELPLLSELLMGCSPNEGGLRTNDACSIIAQCLMICTRNEPTLGRKRPFLQCRVFPTMDYPSRVNIPQYQSTMRGPVPISNQYQHPYSPHRRSVSYPSLRIPIIDNVDLDAQNM